MILTSTNHNARKPISRNGCSQDWKISVVPNLTGCFSFEEVPKLMTSCIFVHGFLHNLYFHERYSRHHVAIIGNLRKGESDENGKKALGRIRLRLAKQLLCFNAFLHISLSSLYDYDVKLPYLTSRRM